MIFFKWIDIGYVVSTWLMNMYVLELKDFDMIIKWFELELTYIVELNYINTTWKWTTNTNCQPNCFRLPLIKFYSLQHIIESQNNTK